LLDKTLIRIDVFLHSLRSILEENLSEYVISTVANMLALHYSLDNVLRQTYPNAHMYADLCTGRIKTFLQKKVILDETFDVAVQTFAIAITPDIPPTEDLPSMNKIRDQEKISEIIVVASLGIEISDKELELLKDVLDISLGSADANDIMNFIGTEPDVVLAILRCKKRNASDIASEISKAAKNAAKTNTITSEFAQLAGLVACAALAFAGNIVAIQSFEAIAAAVIIPVSVVALKYGAEIGEKIGSTLAEFDNGFKSIKAELMNMVPDIAHSPGIGHKINIQEISAAGINVQDIAKSLATHIDTVSTDKEIVKIQKSLQEIKLSANEVGRSK
jgi:hypothetical protein